jgi:hypothetical protein
LLTRRDSLRLTLAASFACSACAHGSAHWPEPIAGASTATLDSPATLRDRIEEQSVCVGARSWSAGSLGNTVLYRFTQVGRKVSVGYFVYWSTERPWGPNVLSYTVLPALAADAFYSHFLYVFPGAKDAIYGPGDIEGVNVEFELDEKDDLQVVRGRAQDATHGDVQLTRADLVDASGRIILLTDVWSHQLGARGGAEYASAKGSDVRCYQRASLQPMTEQVATAFRLGDEHRPSRAKPAWGSPPAEPERDVQTAESEALPTRVE